MATTMVYVRVKEEGRAGPASNGNVGVGRWCALRQGKLFRFAGSSQLCDPQARTRASRTPANVPGGLSLQE
jgi:hypothetical protein